MTLQSRLLVKYLLRAATTKILSKLHNHWDVEVHTVGLVILAMKPLKKINTWMIFLLIAETPQSPDSILHLELLINAPAKTIVSIKFLI